MANLYLCGGGNPEGVRLALRVNRVHQFWENIYLLDDDASKHGKRVMEVELKGGFELLARANPGDQVVNLVARTTQKRKAAQERISAYGLAFATLIDPDVDTYGVTLGNGVTVYRQATLSALAQIGDHSVIFGGANAGHGSVVGPGCVMAPGAVINARVILGEGVYVGTNASILPDLTVGPWATVGANSSVIFPVPAHATVVGVPAELISGDDVALPVNLSSPVVVEADVLQTPILEVWREVLGKDEIGLDDKFFELGGDSQRALILRDRLQAATGQKISMVDVFRFPTVRSLSQHLSQPASLSAVAERAKMRRQRMVAH